MSSTHATNAAIGGTFAGGAGTALFAIADPAQSVMPYVSLFLSVLGGLGILGKQLIDLRNSSLGQQLEGERQISKRLNEHLAEVQESAAREKRGLQEQIDGLMRLNGDLLERINGLTDRLDRLVGDHKVAG